ncbi:Trafficking protein particle complex subunit 31 [Malassezia sp. CBS 17886]|nr:Trafficking protein particle complex subunit 31 [Malassezia sp. CBS 17886]
MAMQGASDTGTWAASFALHSPESAHGAQTYPLTPPDMNTPKSASGPDILERPRDKTRAAEVSFSALQYLFAEAVAYTKERVLGIADLERLLSTMGHRVGVRALVLMAHRREATANSKNPKRETRLLPALLWVHSTLWKAVFGMQADSLERSTESGRSDECACARRTHLLADMISMNEPLLSRGISIPKEMPQLSVEAFTAGIVEGALDSLGFPARVTAHAVPTDAFPGRTTILIKLSREVMDREASMGGP